MMELAESGPRRVQSVARAFSLLEAVAVCPDGARLRDIATTVGLSRSTTHNLLATLESLGYLSQLSPGGPYVLTEQFTELSRGAAGGDEELRDLLHPVLEKLAQETGETCYLAVPAVRDCVYLDAVESAQPLKLGVRVGDRDPLLGTAIGHVLLAFRPATARRIAVEDPEGWAAWSPEVDLARERGFALDLEEFAPGLCCLAVPVTRRGEVRAALCIAGPSVRLPESRLRELADTLRRALPEPR